MVAPTIIVGDTVSPTIIVGDTVSPTLRNLSPTTGRFRKAPQEGTHNKTGEIDKIFLSLGRASLQVLGFRVQSFID